MCRMMMFVMRCDVDVCGLSYASRPRGLGPMKPRPSYHSPRAANPNALRQRGLSQKVNLLGSRLFYCFRKESVGTSEKRRGKGDSYVLV